MDISIIVPLYKGKKYIRHIMEMVDENQKKLKKNQIKKEIEIIFINDYPAEKIDQTDLEGCLDVSIHIYENIQNRGIHESRLRGLAEANGRYVVFLDQDDEISPFYLFRQLSYIGNSDAILCNGICRGNRLIYKDLKQQELAICKEEYIKKGNIITSPGQVLIRRNAIPDKWSQLILKKNGSDDVLLWILMLSEKRSFSLNPFLDYIHKEDGDNTSLNFDIMRRSARELLDVVKGNGILKEQELDFFEKMSIDRIRKYEAYIDIVENWNRILDRLAVFCDKGSYKRIAVYGYGVFGKKLLNSLKDLELNVDFVIDKAVLNFRETECKVCAPEEIKERMDLIIITPIFAKEQIKMNLKKYAKRIVSLDEFIDL